jgi:hypothetical protein
MAKIYQGKVSVFSNANKQLVVKPDVDGKFDQANVAELYSTMLTLGLKHKMDVRIFKPETETAKCDTPVLMADRWGKPYIALLPERKAPGAVKVTVQKLA